jgi:hypothetical protein
MHIIQLKFLVGVLKMKFHTGYVWFENNEEDNFQKIYIFTFILASYVQIHGVSIGEKTDILKSKEMFLKLIITFMLLGETEKVIMQKIKNIVNYLF